MNLLLFMLKQAQPQVHANATSQRISARVQTFSLDIFDSEVEIQSFFNKLSTKANQEFRVCMLAQILFKKVLLTNVHFVSHRLLFVTKILLSVWYKPVALRLLRHILEYFFNCLPHGVFIWVLFTLVRLKETKRNDGATFNLLHQEWEVHEPHRPGQ